MFDFGGNYHCNLACSIYSVLSAGLLFTHLFIMGSPLHGWAGGNVILMGNTAITLIQYFNSIALAWDVDAYWMVSSWIRTTAFVMALV